MTAAAATQTAGDARHWSDQPECLEGTRVVLHFYHEPRAIEVRRDVKSYYVTIAAGFTRLSGSQTVRVQSAEAVLEMLALAVTKRNVAKLPPGAVLVPNAE